MWLYACFEWYTHNNIVLMYLYRHMVKGMLCAQMCRSLPSCWLPFAAVAFAQFVVVILFTFHSRASLGSLSAARKSLLCVQSCEKATHIIHTHPFRVGIHDVDSFSKSCICYLCAMCTRVKEKQCARTIRVCVCVCMLTREEGKKRKSACVFNILHITQMTMR